MRYLLKISIKKQIIRGLSSVQQSKTIPRTLHFAYCIYLLINTVKLRIYMFVLPHPTTL